MRVAQLRSEGRFTKPPGVGVLVKAPKPGQDRRFDLPAIGPKTIENVARAGLAGLAVAAGSAIVAEPDKVSAAADQREDFLHWRVGGGELVNGAPARPLSIYLVAAEESGDALGAALVRALRAAVDGALTLAGCRWTRHGGRGRRQSVLDRRTRHRRRQRHPGAPAADLAAHPRDRRRCCRRATGRAGDHRQPGFHPSGGAPRARPRAVAFRSSIMSRLRSGPGGRAGRAPCAPMSIACWQSCRSSRRRTGASAGRLASMWAIHWLSAWPICAQRRARASAGGAEPPFVLILPGSRSSEIRLLLEVFGDAIARVSARVGPMSSVLPTMPHLLPRVRAGVAGWTVKPHIVTEPAEKWAAFRSARAALAASGTVTLELALAGVPTVAAYRVTSLKKSSRGSPESSKGCRASFSPILCLVKTSCLSCCSMIAPRSALPRRSSRFCPIHRNGSAKSRPSLALTTSWR